MAITLHRLLLGLQSWKRLPEIIRCFRVSVHPVREIFAYLQLKRLRYPYQLDLKSNLRLTLHDWQDLTTAWVVLFGNEYNLHENDRTIVDLGANIGVFSLLAAAELSKARIVAIEPFPENYDRLCHHIEVNGYADRIEPLKKAATGVAGRFKMDDSPNIPGHSRRIGSNTGVEVEGITIEMIMDRFGFRWIDFLKVDIEGGEYELFAKTNNEVLRKIRRIGFEYHSNGKASDLFRRLEKAGFKQTRHPKAGSSGVAEFSQLKPF